MELFDVNIYIYAHREDSPNHDFCLKRLESSMNSGKLFGYAPLALSGFLRITTHPKIFKTPTDLDTSMNFMRLITEHPAGIAVTPGRSHWSIFTHLCHRYKPKGNLIPDVYFAALAIESDCTWVTTDRDFSRFSELKLELI